METEKYIGYVIDRMEREPSVYCLSCRTREYATYAEAHAAAERLARRKFGRASNRYSIDVR